jgi:hypothetical protein
MLSTENDRYGVRSMADAMKWVFRRYLLHRRNDNPSPRWHVDRQPIRDQMSFCDPGRGLWFCWRNVLSIGYGQSQSWGTPISVNDPYIRDAHMRIKTHACRTCLSEGPTADAGQDDRSQSGRGHLGRLAWRVVRMFTRTDHRKPRLLKARQVSRLSGTGEPTVLQVP